VPIAEAADSTVNGYMLCCCATKLTVSEVINACLDNTEGEDLLSRTSKLEHLGPLAELEQHFSNVLAENFKTTIAEALTKARNAHSVC
jgi:hypothetical protein